MVLFGSVAKPLEKEVPRFRRLRRARVAVWHECADIDLAVWLSDLTILRQLKKASGRTVNALAVRREGAGLAHHLVHMHIFEPGTDRFRGFVCHYGECPKGKRECDVAGCGAQPFLQLYEDFDFDRFRMFSEPKEVLFERAKSEGPEGGADSAAGDEGIPF